MSRRNPRDRRVKMLRLWLRALRKDARREADAKRREERRYENIFASSLRCHYTRNMGVRQFCRYLSGVRKGTIL
jgi:hypothetical protein